MKLQPCLKGIEKFCIIRVTDVIVDAREGAPLIIIVVKFLVLDNECRDMVGEPIEYHQYKEEGYNNPKGATQIRSHSEPPPSKSTSPVSKGLNSSGKATVGQSQVTSTSPSSKPVLNRENSLTKKSSPVAAPATSSDSKTQKERHPGPMDRFTVPFKTANTVMFHETKMPPHRSSGVVATQQLRSADPVYTPINSLVPMLNSWIIKARVTKKSDIRQWSSQKGHGTVFSIELIDKDGNEIQGSFFNDLAKKFHPELEVDKVYVISGGTIKQANLRFSSVKNDYQLVFDRRTNFKPAPEDEEIAHGKFNFTKIKDLKTAELNSVVDVLGIVMDCGAVQEVKLRNADETKPRRTIHVFDESLLFVELTIWGNLAQQTDVKPHTIIIVKAVRVTEFQGRRNLQTMNQSEVVTSLPDVPEVVDIIEWQAANQVSIDDLRPLEEGHAATVVSGKKSRCKPIAQIEEESSEITDANPLWSDVKGVITYVKTENPYYQACRVCHKKVVEEADGWRCENCGKVHKECITRYLLTAKITDSSGSMFVNVYDQAGIEIFERSASEIRAVKEAEGDLYRELLTESYFKEFRFRVLTKIDMYAGESRIRHQIISASKPDYKYENSELLKQLATYDNIR
eukprot:TRINITY_DN9349_c0_g1_i2.p1 TRINITY_DN9349_c0_g1~~TRINITY_DN9349_c0_g1_i2.p1  ORF type:complete len:626 (+),score=89.93 TRINITY_DN9349_c0_g1_i2:134-2011(+)